MTQFNAFQAASLHGRGTFAEMLAAPVTTQEWYCEDESENRGKWVRDPVTGWTGPLLAVVPDFNDPVDYSAVDDANGLYQTGRRVKKNHIVYRRRAPTFVGLENGDRTDKIVVTSSENPISGTAWSNVVNGSEELSFSGSSGFFISISDVEDSYIQFELPTSEIIKKIFIPNGLAIGGIWQAEGSSDGTTWAALGAPVEWVASAVWDISANAQDYLYYRLVGVSGSAVNEFISEFYFEMIEKPLHGEPDVSPVIWQIERVDDLSGRETTIIDSTVSSIVVTDADSGLTHLVDDDVVLGSVGFAGAEVKLINIGTPDITVTSTVTMSTASSDTLVKASTNEELRAISTDVDTWILLGGHA